MKKLRLHYSFFVLSAFTFIINFTPKIANAGIICECGTYDCYWDAAVEDCIKIPYFYPCVIFCD